MEHVAGEFRKAAHSQMAATTQRTIRSVVVVVVVVTEDLQFCSLRSKLSCQDFVILANKVVRRCRCKLTK